MVKMAKNLDEIPGNPDKYGSQRCLPPKNGPQHLQKNTWRPFVVTPKKSSWSLWEKNCRQKSHKTFRTSLEKFGQKSFASSGVPSPKFWEGH